MKILNRLMTLDRTCEIQRLDDAGMQFLSKKLGDKLRNVFS